MNNVWQKLMCRWSGHGLVRWQNGYSEILTIGGYRETMASYIEQCPSCGKVFTKYRDIIATDEGDEPMSRDNDNPIASSDLKELEKEIQKYGDNVEYAHAIADRLEQALTRFRGERESPEGVGIGEQERAGVLGQIESLNHQLHSCLIEIRNGLDELDTLV